MPGFKISHIVSAAALCAASTAAFAGGSGKSALNEWAEDAGVSVDQVMTYPSHAIARGESGNAVFHVTVNRAGDVVDAKQVHRVRGITLNSAARRVIDKADFPALPADYDGDTLAFAVKLKYAIVASQSEAQKLKREGRVSSEQIAGKASPSFASIEILDGNADD